MRITGVVALLIVGAWLAGCAKQDPYPVKNVQQASQSGNYRGWQLQEVLGDQTGPFRGTGDAQLNAGASGKFVWYTVDGTKERRDLSHLKGEVLLGMFQNKAGNRMVLVFAKEPASQPTTTQPTTAPSTQAAPRPPDVMPPDVLHRFLSRAAPTASIGDSK